MLPGLALRYFLAKILVFKKIRRKLGGRIRFFISGGAPLSKSLAEFFLAADVLILEGYGLTETSPVISVNSPDDFRLGTVGKPLPGIEVKLAPDGEILTRSASVMTGYFNNPEATQKVIKDGWFYTGDIGEIDADGFLAITDRKKDIIVTSGGKNISPQNLEGLLQGDPYCKQAVVIGDRRNYLVALIYPNPEQIEKCAAELQKHGLSWNAKLSDPKILQHAAQSLNERLSHRPAYEQIKYFAFIPEELTQAGGDLTPTLKVRRRKVMEKYAHLIESLYEKGDRWKAEIHR